VTQGYLFRVKEDSRPLFFFKEGNNDWWSKHRKRLEKGNTVRLVILPFHNRTWNEMDQLFVTRIYIYSVGAISELSAYLEGSADKRGRKGITLELLKRIEAQYKELVREKQELEQQLSAVTTENAKLRSLLIDSKIRTGFHEEFT
jgi:hypothetical protein